MSKLNKLQDLDQSILDINNTLVELKAEIDDSRRNLNKVNKELEVKYALVNQVRKIEEIGLSLETFERIKKSIVKYQRSVG